MRGFGWERGRTSAERPILGGLQLPQDPRAGEEGTALNMRTALRAS